MCETYGCYRYEFVQRMLRWKQYKYIAHCGDLDELYDLERIPSRWRTGLKMRDIARFSVK